MSKKRKVVSGIHLPFCVILLAEKEVCYMSVKKSETALAERIGRKKLRGIKYLLLAVPFLIYVFAFSYVAALVLLITSFNIVCVWLGCVFAGLGIGGLLNLLASMIISVFGRDGFMSANSIIYPLANVVRTLAFILMAMLLKVSGGSFTLPYVVFIVIDIIGAGLIMLIPYKKA